jgi:plastocyanin
MSGDFFFVIGIVLVLAAVTIAFVGIRSADRFPPNRAAMVGLTALFVAGVATTMAFAIVKSNDEQTKRNAKLAAEEKAAEPPANPGGQPQVAGGGNQQPPQPTGVAQAVDVTSPADGGLTYEPNGLQAKPGSLTITYTNPSPVPHSIAVADASGNVLGEVQPFTNGKQSVDLTNLAPGEYVFYCTVPGHREAGMQGNITVGAGGASGQ